MSTSRPPLVWLPPLSADCRLFAGIGERLTAIPCLSSDLPGYGGRALSPARSMADIADNLARDLDAAGVETAVLCGHSMGGMAAIEAAVRHADRVRGLILSGTTPRFGSRDGSFQEAFLKARLGALDAGGTMEDVARAAPAEMLAPGAPGDAAEHVVSLFREVPEAAYRQALKVLVTFDRASEIAAIAAPALVVAGSEDRNAPLPTMQKMAGAMPAAELVVLDGVGHMAPLESPDKFAAAIGAFFNKVA
ncbi:MAG: alpha/beta fold hydrolase [Flavobacteriaceae bacterium]